MEVYISKLDDIKKNFLENEVTINIQNISFENKIYKHLFSKAHLYEHTGLLVFSIILGVVGLPVLSIGIHIICGLINFFYDHSKKIDTLKENMETFKRKLEIKLNGDQRKFLDSLEALKNNVEKEIELIVDSQNAEFKGIKDNQLAFKKLIEQFKEINNIKELF